LRATRERSAPPLTTSDQTIAVSPLDTPHATPILGEPSWSQPRSSIRVAVIHRAVCAGTKSLRWRRRRSGAAAGSAIRGDDGMQPGCRLTEPIVLNASVRISPSPSRPRGPRWPTGTSVSTCEGGGWCFPCG
jgi:hypothetical protein